MTSAPFRLCSRIPDNVDVAAKTLPHPTRAQTLVEWMMFGVFGSILIIASVALVFANSPSHRQVPNRVRAGLAADRVNLLLVICSTEAPRSPAEALMLLSLKPSTADVAVIAIPVDLWVKLGRHGTRRLGTATAVGSTSSYPGRGPGLVSDAVARVLDQPVHAYIRATPKQVARLVDTVGGIDILARQGAYETKAGTRFRRGRQSLDGSRAVQYAFSRRMAGQANDRFAREARQYAVAGALISRLSIPTVAISGVGLDTNLAPEQLAWLCRTVAGQATRTVTLAPYVDAFEVETLLDGGEALRPRLGDFKQLQQVAAEIFLPSRQPSAALPF